jgi:tetratricopeptide (TPR) repeat protein
MSQEDIQLLNNLLETHRRHLSVLIQQRTNLGFNFTPAHIHLEIDDKRKEIKQTKEQLRQLGQVVEDRIVDTADDAAQLRELYLPTDYVPEPHSLPPGSRMDLASNPLFVGRDEQLKQIAADLQTGGSTVIAAITGMGGVGKTQLASEFVHRYGHFFSGGVYWLSFAQTENIEHEIVACGEAMDLPNFASLEFPEQVRQVQKLWQEPIPRLLVFDSCEDEQVLRKYRPKGSACHVLLTSRRQYWDSSLRLREQRLKPLSRQQSIALLCSFSSDLSADDPALHSLAERLGDLPLALHVAGSYLKRYQNSVSPAQYLEKLQSAPLQNFALRALSTTPTEHERDLALTLAVSYQQLDPNEPIDALASDILAHVAHFAPGEALTLDLLQQVISSLLPAKEPELDFEDALLRLEEVGLIERQREGQDTLRLHRLIGAFILSADPHHSAQHTVERYFIDLVQPGKNDPITKLTKSDYERFLPLRENLIHVQYITRQAIKHNPAHAAYLSLVLGNQQYYVNDFAVALDYCQQALALYRDLGDQLGIAASLTSLGDIYQRQKQDQLALEHYQQAQQLFRDTDSTIGLANIASSIGYFYLQRKNLPAALEHYQQAQQLYSDANIQIGLANTLRSIGDIYQLRKDSHTALQLYSQAQQILQESGERLGLATTLRAIGDIYRSRKEAQTALDYYQQAYQLFSALGEPSGLAYTLKSIGEFFQQHGDAENALEKYQEAQRLYEELNDRVGLAYTSHSIGKIHVFYHQFDQALNCYQLAQILYQETNEALGLANTLLSSGELYQLRQQFDQALSCYQQAQQLYQQANDQLGLANTFSRLSQLALIKQNQTQADQLLQEAIKIYQELGSTYDMAVSISKCGWILQLHGRYQEAQPYLLQAAELFAQIEQHDLATQCHQDALLTGPATPADQLVSVLIVQFRAAFADALNNPAIEPSELKQNLEALARWAERNKEMHNDFLALSAELSAFATQIEAAITV